MFAVGFMDESNIVEYVGLSALVLGGAPERQSFVVAGQRLVILAHRCECSSSICQSCRLTTLIPHCSGEFQGLIIVTKRPRIVAQRSVGHANIDLRVGLSLSISRG